MKICHVISTFHPVVGGAQTATLLLCRELTRLGLDVVVLTRRLPGTSRMEEHDGALIVRAGLPRSDRLGAASFGFHALWILMTDLRAYSILHIQNIDTPMLVGLVGRLVGRRRVFATMHGNVIPWRRKTLMGRARVRLMVTLLHGFTAISPSLRRQLVEAGARPSRISLIPNGVDVELIQPATAAERRGARDALGIEPSIPVVLFLGRLGRVKGLDVLLRAWSRLPPDLDTLLVVAGDGPERASLASLAHDLNITNLIWLGFRSDTQELLKACDLLVLPSWREGLPMAVLEAAAGGLAIIASDLPGNRWILEESGCGLLFPAGDDAVLGAHLKRLLQNPSAVSRMGLQGPAMVAHRFDIRCVARSHERMYANTLMPEHSVVPVVAGSGTSEAVD